jgi:hypothetical protein
VGGLHLTVTETRALLTCLPALATMFAAFRTTPAKVTAMTGALATLGTAALAFGVHWPVADIGADAPAVAAGIALLLRMHVSPKVAVKALTAALAPTPAPAPASAPVVVTAPHPATQVSATSSAPVKVTVVQPTTAAATTAGAAEPANGSAGVAKSPF